MRIEEALSGIGFPVCEFPYRGKAATYATYHMINIDGSIFGDSAEQTGENMTAIDLFTPNDWKTKIDAIKERLSTAGISVESIGPEIWETDDQVYHIPMTVVEDT